MIKTLLASAVVGFGLLFSGMAHAADADPNAAQTKKLECITPAMVEDNNYAKAKEAKIDIAILTLHGADATAIRTAMVTKYGDKVLAFDEVTFISSKQYADTILMIIYNEGCVVSGGPISAEDFAIITHTSGGTL